MQIPRLSTPLCEHISPAMYWYVGYTSEASSLIATEINALYVLSPVTPFIIGGFT